MFAVDLHHRSLNALALFQRVSELQHIVTDQQFVEVVSQQGCVDFSFEIL